MIGIDVVHNTFIDAVVKGDFKTVIEAVFKKGASIVDIEQLKSMNLKDPNLRSTIGPEIQKKLMDILTSELKNPDLALEYKVKIQEAIQAINSNLEKSGQNLVDYFVFGSRTDLSPDELKMREYLMQTGGSEINKAMGELLNDPNKIKDILKLENQNSVNEYMRNFLKSRTSSDTASSFIDSSLTDKINTAIGLTGGQTMTAEQIKTKINSYIDDTDFYSLLKSKTDTGFDYKAALKTTIMTKLASSSFSESEKSSIADSLVSLASQAETKVQDEKNKFLAGVQTELGESKYSNRIVIDTYLGGVRAEGNKRITFDAKMPLNEFIAKSTNPANGNPGNIIELLDNGNPVVYFNGNNVMSNRIISGGAYVDINRIVNENTGETWKLGVDSSLGVRSYTLYNPDKLVSQSYTANGYLRQTDGRWARRTGRGLGPGGAWQHPFMGSNVVRPSEGDIGANPNSRIEIFDKTDQITGPFGGKLKQKFIIPSLPNGFPTGLIGNEVVKAIDAYSPGLIQQLGGQENINAGLGQADDYFFKYAREYNAKVPLVVTDALFVAENPDSIRAIFQFMGQQSTQPNQNKVVITPEYIEVNGNKATQFTDSKGKTQSLGPALRQFMRGYDVVVSNPSVNPFRSYSKSEVDAMQGGMK
jgi:hypothetical protein